MWALNTNPGKNVESDRLGHSKLCLDITDESTLYAHAHMHTQPSRTRTHTGCLEKVIDDKRFLRPFLKQFFYRVKEQNTIGYCNFSLSFNTIFEESISLPPLSSYHSDFKILASWGGGVHRNESSSLPLRIICNMYNIYTVSFLSTWNTSKILFQLLIQLIYECAWNLICYCLRTFMVPYSMRGTQREYQIHSPTKTISILRGTR